MSCSTCYNNIRHTRVVKPPRFGISNGWVIGSIPENIIDGEIDDILTSSITRIRMFANVYSYSAGAHKAIKGHHVLFINDPDHVGKSFDFLMKSGAQPEMYVMICGRVTPAQREIIRRRCTINANDYMTILNWLINNHPSYSDMVLPENCPQPIFIGGFDEEVNNTDNVDGSNSEKKKILLKEKKYHLQLEKIQLNQQVLSSVRKILYYHILKERNQHFF